MFGLPDWSLMGGFSSSSYVTLTREHQPEDGISHHGNQLLVCIHNKVLQLVQGRVCNLNRKEKKGNASICLGLRVSDAIAQHVSYHWTTMHCTLLKLRSRRMAARS